MASNDAVFLKIALFAEHDVLWASFDCPGRDRWVGPGVVVLSNNGTVYVGMRTRLWRCSSDQLRPALPSEVLGRELATDPGLSTLLRQVLGGVHAGAVDVAREGPPGVRDQLAPVQRLDEGVELAVEPLRRHADLPSEAAQSVEAIPSQLLPPVGHEPSLGAASEEPATPSRRSSTEEPAGEPESGQDGVLLEAIPEESGPSSADVPVEPPPKSQRVEPREDEPAADQPSSTSSAPGVRVPGTPVGRRLSTASRARPGPYGSLRGVPSTPPVGWLPGPPGLTPVEELPVENRVQRQVQEIEAVRQREDDLSLFHDGEPAESLSEAFLQERWSGSFYNYSLGTTPMSLKEDGEWCFAAKRNDEISLKELSKEERLLFDKSDKVEWDAILATKAVRVISGKEAERIRQVYPDRIISSRMVRRKKPQPELHSWKAKSRWCLHGHADPDTGTLVTYAPTPQSEGIMLFLQAGLNLRMRFSFTDVKNAFCQSSKLKRPRGPLFAEPCEGLHLPPGAIIAIDVPVYGLDDAPASWRLTVASFLTDDLKFQRNVVEPCWYSLFCPNTRRCVAQVLVEVDDFIVGAVDEWRDWLKERLQGRFLFGKWEDDEAEYAGRHVKCTPEGIEVDQGKYVLEQVHPVPLPRGRKAQKDDALSTEEFNALRSLVYKVNWLAWSGNSV